MITATPEAIEALRLLLAGKAAHTPIRIHLHSTGCCDASLGLMADNARANDLIQKVQGIEFLISPEVRNLTGDIEIAYSNEKHRMGFVLTAQRPISEWDGFGVCTLKV